MPLQNRLTPQGLFVAAPVKGLFMGNRGGRLHDPATRKLGTRRHLSKRWICCALEFRGRARQVWGPGYTELFFLDEVTAFAAGHRPCFECRREAALAFVAAAGAGSGVGEIDAELHRQRLDGRQQRRHAAELKGLPDGAVVLLGGTPHGLRGGRLMTWRPDGWAAAADAPRGLVDVLTPPLVLEAFRAGYRPVWHPTAAQAPL